jgi:hypothetical protein
MSQLVFPNYNERPFDLAGALNTATQYQAGQLQLQRLQQEALLRQRESEMQPVLMRLQGEALRGTPGALDQLRMYAPAKAMKTEQFGSEQKKREAERVEAARVESLRQLDQTIALLSNIEKSPDALPDVIATLRQAGALDDEKAQAIADPATALKLRDALTLQRTMLDKPIDPLKQPLFYQVLATGKATPEQARRLSMQMAEKMAEKGGGASGPSITVVTGGTSTSPLTTASVTKAQGELTDAATSIAALQTLLSSYDEKYRTAYGRARANVGDAVAFMGLSTDKEFRAAKQTWDQEFDQFFNAYRKEITGAGAAVAEIDSLYKSIMSKAPDLVQASLQQLLRKYARNAAIQSEILARGITVGSEQYWREFNSKVLEAQTAEMSAVPTPNPSIEAFGNKLKAQGIPDDEIIRRIRAGEWQSEKAAR